MGNPYAFGRRSQETAQLQAALNDKGFDVGTPDGIYGRMTQAAVTTIQHQLGVVATGTPDKAVLVFLGLVPATSPSLFDQLGTLLSLVQLAKGKTMTQDQINGLIRSALLTIGGYLIGRGLVTAELWAWISAGILTVGPVVWSWISNRPKTIVPIASK